MLKWIIWAQTTHYKSGEFLFQSPVTVCIVQEVAQWLYWVRITRRLVLGHAIQRLVKGGYCRAVTSAQGRWKTNASVDEVPVQNCWRGTTSRLASVGGRRFAYLREHWQAAIVRRSEAVLAFEGVKIAHIIKDGLIPSVVIAVDDETSLALDFFV